MYSIYLATNKQNDKVYVGQTCQKMSSRWYDHGRKAHRGDSSHFCNALRKYGAEAFDVQVIHQVEEPEIDNMEKLWIIALDAKNPKVGYNMQPGGRDALIGHRKPSVIRGNPIGEHRYLSGQRLTHGRDAHHVK